MPRPSDLSTLRDIQIQCHDIAELLSGQNEAGFLADRSKTAALERFLEIIGEATKRLTADLRVAHPEVDWRGWAGLRDVVIHAYDQVVYADIWQVAIDEVPVLSERVTAILKELDPSSK